MVKGGNKIMVIKNLKIKKGETVRKAVYIDGKKHYAEIRCIKIYPYLLSHSRDLRRQHTNDDRW